MQAPGPAHENEPGHAMLEDWLTIWHSELAAMLQDRELQETNLRLLDAFAAQARAMLQSGAPPGPSDGNRPTSSGCTGSPPAPRATPLVAAPDARDAELERLADRVAELERKLAGD